ncbi:MAG: DUF1385 domain-containing protein [Vallitaleaceae bacterium]|jgi:uncharacterized protein YqhQ|nr:DUF1385 domain-containing protein [Vallitaleaceae bacterium]
MKRVNIGGQAVIEGVMMKNGDDYAVAIRKPDQEIIIDKKQYVSFTKRHKLLNLPIFRGMVAFVESMVIGMKILTYSAEFFEVEEEQGKFEKKLEDKYGKKKMDGFFIGLAVVLAMLFSVGLFILLPLFISQLLKPVLPNARMVNLVDGLMRVVILLVYMAVIRLMNDIKRVFQYHGAEHKTINCLEHEEELTVENVRKHSRYHKRCGTSFIFLVVLISVGVLTLFNVDTFLLRLGVRLLLLPFIAGLSYEVIKLLGRTDNKISMFFSKPGMWLQQLTTIEPDDDQIEVAIASVNAVLPKEDTDEDTRTA